MATEIKMIITMMSDLSTVDATAALRRIATDNFRPDASDAEYERMVAEDYAILRAVVTALEQAEPVSEEREECARDLDEIVGGHNVVGQEAAICARAARLLRAPQQQAKPVAWLWTVKGEGVPCAASLVEGNPDRHVSTPLYAAPPATFETDLLIRKRP